MKFRTKLYLLFAGLIFCTTFLGLIVLYKEVEKLLLNELRSKVLTIAATGAQMIDGNLLAKIEQHSDIEKPEFNALVDTMRTIRRANRREDVYVVYIYTVHPDPNQQGHLLIGVDAANDPAVFAYPGDAYPEKKGIGLRDHLNEPWAPKTLIRNQWGIFLSGYAPIHDKNGTYVGTLAVDLSAHSVNEALNRLRMLAASSLALTLIAGLIAASFLAQFVARSLEKINEAVEHIGRGEFKTRVIVQGQDEFAQLASAINTMAKGLEEHAKLKQNFIRYVSKHVMEKILAQDISAILQGERRKITVLFSDIRGFTTLSEKLPPEQVVSFLNEYLAKMLDVIFANNGTLDKFLGDGLMVEFGAPLDDAQQERHAVETAIQMQAALGALNQKWSAQGKPSLRIGIGIHTGLAIVGNIGSEKRMEYTAIGDTVNVASRLEHASKDMNVSILISETTRKGLPNTVNVTSLGSITLPGRETPLEVFKV